MIKEKCLTITIIITQGTVHVRYSIVVLDYVHEIQCLFFVVEKKIIIKFRIQYSISFN